MLLHDSWFLSFDTVIVKQVKKLIELVWHYSWVMISDLPCFSLKYLYNTVWGKNCVIANTVLQVKVMNARYTECYIYIHKSPCSSFYTYWHSRRCDMFHSHDLWNFCISSEVVHFCTRSCILSTKSNSYFFLDYYICCYVYFISLYEHHTNHVQLCLIIIKLRRPIKWTTIKFQN